MKHTLFLCLSLVCSISLFAVPAKPGPRQLRQPDGQTITLFAHGDEVHHFYADNQGNIMQKDAQGYWQPSGEKATKALIRAQRAKKAPRARAAKRTNGSTWPNKGLVILVNFSDVKFKAANDNKAFDDLLNGDNYTHNGATGSVKKYYSDQSDGQFIPEFHVYGPVTVSKERSYYGSNKSNGDDKYLGAMVAEACQLAYEQYNINLKDFDLDNDGYVDFVDILYAGVGEADSDEENSIWPCEWALSASDYRKELTLGGTKIDLFSCHQELEGGADVRAGIGTPCHEFGHVFGLPDFYDYDYPTLGEWDVMDGGAYLNNSNTPPAFSGYERMFAGWAKPALLTESGTYTLNELQGSQQVYIISTTGKHNLDAVDPDPETFYILENRQNTNWDTYLPGHGMLIWKVQYDQDDWFNNTVNSHPTAEQGMAIMAADGEVDHEVYQGAVYTYGDAGDPFPGTKKITSYTKINNYKITDIAEQNRLITFTLTTKGGTTPTPSGNCDNYEYAFSEKVEAGTVELDGMQWTLNTDAGYFGYDTNNTPSKGAQFGSKNNPATQLTFTTSATADCSIKKVTVSASTGSKGNASLSVFVGDTQIGTSKDLSSANTAFNFTPADNQQGDLTIRIDNKAKVAVYISAINIEFDETSTAIVNIEENTLLSVSTEENGLHLTAADNQTQVAVYNIMGQLVFSDIIGNQPTTIDAAKGIYIISAQHADKKQIKKVVVK